MKPPEVLEVIVATVVVSNFIVTLVLLANLEPVTVTVVPTGPLIGDSVIVASDVTVNGARAVLPGPVATTL